MYCISNDSNVGFGYAGVLPVEFSNVDFISELGCPARAREWRARRFASVASRATAGRLAYLMETLSLPEFENYESGKALIGSYSTKPRENRPNVIVVESSVLGMTTDEFAEQMTVLEGKGAGL